jgi:RND superfamily putative drug exporter
MPHKPVQTNLSITRVVASPMMLALLTPVFAMRLDSSDAGTDPPHFSSRTTFDLLAKGFGAQPRIAPSGTVAVIQAYPNSAPLALATTNLVNRMRDTVLPALQRRTGMPVLVGGCTAASMDFSHVLASKLPLFFSIVILLSALLLLVIFGSVVISVQAAVMNLLTIGAALGVTVAVFQNGWFASALGVQQARSSRGCP